MLITNGDEVKPQNLSMINSQYLFQVFAFINIQHPSERGFLMTCPEIFQTLEIWYEKIIY